MKAKKKKHFIDMQVTKLSDAWRIVRCGVFTSSRAYDAFRRTTKGEWRAERRYYQTELVLERLTSKPVEPRTPSHTMLKGNEPYAIEAWKANTGLKVRTVGFVRTPTIGCSPDGVIGDYEGLLIVKCPAVMPHYETLAQLHRPKDDTHDHLSPIPDEYLMQIRHCLFVTGAHWADYVSYHPDFPESLQLAIVRVTPEDVALAQYADDVQEFLREVDAQLAELKQWAQP